MARKIFNSFEEIEQELEILQLQNQLMRIKAKRSAENTLASLKPGSLLLDSLGSVGNYLRGSGTTQKLIVMWLAKRLLK
jgi:hypothetical protein